MVQGLPPVTPMDNHLKRTIIAAGGHRGIGRWVCRADAGENACIFYYMAIPYYGAIPAETGRMYARLSQAGIPVGS
ncbi:MAG: hypothetical protein R6T92_02645 [Desulfosalsimonadaceae bacterium]